MTDGALMRWVSAPASKLATLFLRTPALARTPITLYQKGFGWILGSRMLLLEHIGRSSGRRRFVVLEVLANPGPDTYVVASGFGESAQWFRNVMAEPRVWISTGRLTSVPAQARRMTGSEADAALGRYIAQHPRAWATLKEVLEQNLDGRIDPPGTALPLVELTVRAS